MVTHLSTLLTFHKLRSRDQTKVFRIRLYVSNVWFQYRWTAVSTGNTFQDLSRLRKTADNTEHYI